MNYWLVLREGALTRASSRGTPDYQATALSVLGLNGSNGSNGGNGSSGRQQIGNVTDGRSCRPEKRGSRFLPLRCKE